MNTFTKGAWVRQGSEIVVRDDSDTQSYGMMLTVARVDEWDFRASYEANAHLIAAAPEMYAALRAFLDFVSDGNTSIADYPDLWANAEKALAKAEGKL